jgi:D-amino-acid oxidase
MRNVAIVGAGVSGLTCAMVLAERGYRAAIFAEETGSDTTSAAAGAIWYPYDAEPADKVIAWALETYKILVGLVCDKRSGVSMIDLRTFSRARQIQIPEWAHALGARRLHASSVATGLRPVSDRAQRGRSNFPAAFTSGFVLRVPLIDTTIHLDYLAKRFVVASGEINANVRLARLEDISRDFDIVVNCAGIGAKTLTNDSDLEPHRGQVAIVPKIELSCAIVCDDAPLMYAIPRANDCVFGGTNEVSDDRNADPAATLRILAECSRVLNIDQPKVLAERVGLRPFRKSGVRLESARLGDGRSVIHNYGHGGSGFTLSWGCAHEVFELARNL